MIAEAPVMVAAECPLLGVSALGWIDGGIADIRGFWLAMVCPLL